MGYTDPTTGVWVYEPGDPDAPMHQVLNRQGITIGQRLTQYAESIADDPTVYAAAVAAMQDAAVQEQLSWDKTATLLTESSNLSTLTPGIYRVGNATVATALNLPIKDVSAVTVVAMSTSNQLALLEQWGYDGAGGVVRWQAWRDVAGVIGEWTGIQKAWDKTDGLLTTSTDFAALKPGLYYVPNKTVAEALALPILDVGYVQVVKHGVTASFEQTAYAGTGRGPLKATAWRDQFGDVGEWTVADARNEHLVRERAMQLRASKKVTTPGGVVLIFDHGLTKFKSTIWPLLQARGIPVTLALNPGTMADANNSGASYADIRSWIGTGLVEPANHSYDHATIPFGDAAALERAVRGSREELEAHLGVPVDSWVHPGNDLSEFVVTDTDPAVYATTDAGRLILASHGAVSGVASSGASVRPLGEPLLGLNGIWIDSGTTPAQAAIQAAIDGGGYQIIRFHPQFLNAAGYLTTAQITAFLDWIKTKMTAGELTALTFREALTARHQPRAVERDTGWRNITSLMSVTPTAGTIYLRRSGSGVSIRIENLRFAGATSGTILGLPTGFRPSITEATTLRGVNGVAQVSGAGFLQLFSYESNRIDGSLDLTTSEAWPTSLPGLPV